jgi:hypothetical protein
VQTVSNMVQEEHFCAVWDLGMCVPLTLIQSVLFQAFSLNDRFNYNTENITTMHFGMPGNNKHTNVCQIFTFQNKIWEI